MLFDFFSIVGWNGHVLKRGMFIYLGQWSLKLKDKGRNKSQKENEMYFAAQFFH